MVLLDQAGNITVTGGVHYPEGKYIPMLKPELRQKQIIKRITARRYGVEE